MWQAKQWRQQQPCALYAAPTGQDPARLALWQLLQLAHVYWLVAGLQATPLGQRRTVVCQG